MRSIIGSSEFETRHWTYFLLLPFMWLLILYVTAKKFVCKIFLGRSPKINTVWFDGFGTSPRQVKEGQASWKALAEIYNYQFGDSRRPWLDRFFSDFWQGINLNCRAARNRRKIVSKEIPQALMEFSDKEEVRILSLACGSAQPVVEAVAQLRKDGFRPAIKVKLLDKFQSPLDYSMDLARVYGVAECFSSQQADLFLRDWLVHANNFKPHVVEMVGLLDYPADRLAIFLIRQIHRFLPPGGVFITCNICPNPERKFLEVVVNWEKMVYRTPDHLREIMVASGFRPDNVRLHPEPLGVHCLAICRKE